MAKGKKTGGRVKGQPNKATANAREAIAAFVDANVPRLNAWLDEIAATDGPAAAFRCVESLIEYHVPKLARTELTGHEGQPLIPPGGITFLVRQAEDAEPRS